MPSVRDVRRRWFGAFFLIVAAGLLIWGQTVFKPYLEGIGYLFYWAVCLLLTALAVFTALLDVRVLRRRTRDEQRELFKRTAAEFELAGPEPGENRPRGKARD